MNRAKSRYVLFVAAGDLGAIFSVLLYKLFRTIELPFQTLLQVITLLILAVALASVWSYNTSLKNAQWNEDPKPKIKKKVVYLKV